MSIRYRKKLVKRMASMASAPPPAPWRRVGYTAIGGLVGVGFAPASDRLLVVSHQGAGVFDATTGDRLARDADALDYDDVRCQAIGIGPLAGITIAIAGDFGGGLTRRTRDGWTLSAFDLEPLTPTVFVEPPLASVLDDRTRGQYARLEPRGELRAFGFSPTGNAFVVAESAGIDWFTRSL